MQTISIRNMNRQEIDLALNWLVEQGANPGKYDVEAFYRTDQTGFFAATLNDEPIGLLSAVAYDDDYGFVSFNLVQPAHEGQGVEIQLWDQALTYLGGRIVGVDATRERQPTCEKLGLHPAYRHIRYEGRGGIDAPKSTQYDIVPLDQIPFPVLAAYDRRIFGAERAVFLKWWLRQPNAVKLAMLRGDKIVGYGLIRPCQTGWRVGPLFADTPQIAKDLVKVMLNQLPTGPVYMDMPDANPAALELARTLRMKPVSETQRMYRGDAPDVPLHQVFGATLLNLC